MAHAWDLGFFYWESTDFPTRRAVIKAVTPKYLREPMRPRQYPTVTYAPIPTCRSRSQSCPSTAPTTPPSLISPCHARNFLRGLRFRVAVPLENHALMELTLRDLIALLNTTWTSPAAINPRQHSGHGSSRPHAYICIEAHLARHVIPSSAGLASNLTAFSKVLNNWG